MVVAERATDDTNGDLETIRLIKAEIFATAGVTVSDVCLVRRGWLVKTTSGKISRDANTRDTFANLETAHDRDGTYASGRYAKAAPRCGLDVRLCRKDFGEGTVAPDIRGWDSLSHTVFMMNVEQEFGIEFPLESISSLGTVADLATAISELVNQPKPTPAVKRESAGRTREARPTGGGRNGRRIPCGGSVTRTREKTLKQAALVCCAPVRR